MERQNILLQMVYTQPFDKKHHRVSRPKVPGANTHEQKIRRAGELKTVGTSEAPTVLRSAMET
ncbi:hypothetical protein ElyMa_000583500, partial [Elysia marginata]